MNAMRLKILEELVLSFLLLLCAYCKAVVYEVDYTFLIFMSTWLFMFLFAILRFINYIIWPKNFTKILWVDSRSEKKIEYRKNSVALNKESKVQTNENA
jgi:membrane protein implicated in regulation of membrane protease activity